MLNIALFGPPGAGKGTQSRQLVERFNLCYISTGDLLRKELAADSDLGKKAKDIIASGNLVSDEIIVQILEKTIAENKHNTCVPLFLDRKTKIENRTLIKYISCKGGVSCDFSASANESHHIFAC